MNPAMERPAARAVVAHTYQQEVRHVMTQSERFPRLLELLDPKLRQRRTTGAELYQASTALAMSLLRSLAEPPLIDRVHALQVCADAEPFPAISIQALIQCEISFQISIFAVFDNEALTSLSALLHEPLDRSTQGIAFPSTSNGPEPLEYPRLREIVDLVSNGFGDEAVRLAHHRSDRIYALLVRDSLPMLASVSAGGRG